MKATVRRTLGYGDVNVDALAKDVFAAFSGILDLSVHETTVVWSPPLQLLVPFADKTRRQVSPKLVLCGRAKNLTDPTILVTPSGCAFDWLGDSKIRVDGITGLTIGDKYELTFLVVG